MKNRTAVYIAMLCLMIGYLTLQTASHHQSVISPKAKAADFTSLEVPAVTHGFSTAPTLPNGDLFLLPRPLTLALAEMPDGAEITAVNFDTFGGSPEMIGALPNTQPSVLSASAPNTKVKAVSCAESIWDGNMFIAAKGNVVGDTVRFFLEDSEGKPAHELALFTVQFNGLVVTDLHPEIMLFVNNRKAMGPSTHKGDFIPMSDFAGESGNRSGLLTFSWPMSGNSALQGCYRVGIELARGSAEGKLSAVVTDLVVNRNRVPGDENNAGLGLLGRLTGGFPTGIPCKAECPFAGQLPDPPTPNTGNGGGTDCNAICYRSPQYFLLNINSLPRGTVLISGVNYNRPVSTSDKQKLTLALRGGFTAPQKFNEEFVAAQLNVLNAGGDGSPKVFYAMEGRLSCYFSSFEDVTLSNGFVLSLDTQLKDVYQQARFCVTENRVADMPALTRIFDTLNGNNPLAACNNQR